MALLMNSDHARWPLATKLKNLEPLIDFKVELCQDWMSSGQVWVTTRFSEFLFFLSSCSSEGCTLRDSPSAPAQDRSPGVIDGGILLGPSCQVLGFPVSTTSRPVPALLLLFGLMASHSTTAEGGCLVSYSSFIPIPSLLPGDLRYKKQDFKMISYVKGCLYVSVYHMSAVPTQAEEEL